MSAEGTSFQTPDAVIATASVAAALEAAVSEAAVSEDTAFRSWLDHKVSILRPLHERACQHAWDAAASGKSEHYEAAAAVELALHEQMSDPQELAYLRRIHDQKCLTDPLLIRQAEMSLNNWLSTSFDPGLMSELVGLSSQINNRFNTFRADVAGKPHSDNDIEQILRSSTDLSLRQEAWEASKELGRLVERDALALVRLRNQGARSLGFDNYYSFSLHTSELKEDRLFQLLDEMAQETDEPFAQIKQALDEQIARRFKVSLEELRPWHYGDRFFQETPGHEDPALDEVIASCDLVAAVAEFFDSIGLPARAVIAQSDLSGRPGKYQHAFCMDLDRRGDVRVMCSVERTEYWLETLLHELGHAVYNLGFGDEVELPFVLRTPAHTLTTEGIANMMGNLALNAGWLQRFAGLPADLARSLDQDLRVRSRVGALIFARWSMVVVYFERELYRNPDQDLNALWWKLVGRFQGLTCPPGRNAPDWASKIHLISAPVYYHNYLLGDLYAAQLHAKIGAEFFPGVDLREVIYADRAEVGAFLTEKVFRPGARKRWDHFVLESTGQTLSAKAFGEAFLGGHASTASGGFPSGH